MPSENEPDPTGLSPEDAFDLLGEEMRSAIVRALGNADGPLSFSTLRERAGIRDSGQFNYHLGKLVGHFVRKTDDGYRLTQAGERVVEAVRSGTVTDAPAIEPTPVDETCHFCGGAVVVSYRHGQLDMYCTECDGAYGDGLATGNGHPPEDHGWLGGLDLPPAGVEGRTAAQALAAAVTLSQAESMTASAGVCPRCSASLDRHLEVCSDHDTADGICPACDRRREAAVAGACTTCNFEIGGSVLMACFSDVDFLSFMCSHGYNPFAPDSVLAFYGAIAGYETDIRSTNPLRIRVTLSLDGDTYARTVSERAEGGIEVS